MFIETTRLVLEDHHRTCQGCVAVTLTFDDCDPQVNEPDQRPRSPNDSLVVDNDSTDNARFRRHITSVVVARSGETGSKSKRNNERIRNPELVRRGWF